MNGPGMEPVECAAGHKPNEKKLRRLWWMRLLGLVLLILVIYFVGVELWRNIVEMRRQQIPFTINPLFVALAMLCLMGARVMNSLNTWLLLKAMGADLPAHKVVGAVWLSSLGRYIPGKVAVVAGSMTMLTRMGARLPVVGAALLLSVGIMILISMAATTPLFFLPEVRQHLPSAPLFAALVLGLGLVCLHPPIFLSMCNVALRVIKREPVPGRVRAGAFWGAIALGVFRIGFIGAAVWMSARALSPVGPELLLHALGSAAMATVVGFLAVFSPAGFGVQEAVYLFTFKPVLGAQVAVLVIMFRLLQLCVDMIAGAIGGTIMRKERSAAAMAEAPEQTTAGGGRSGAAMQA